MTEGPSSWLVAPFFSGSYEPADVRLLLKPIHLPSTCLEERERLIQAGIRHYSEMIGEERLPSARYLEEFHSAVDRNIERLGRDVFKLARLVNAARQGEITVVSLARAGTPVGVVLRRVLAKHFGRQVAHYSVSIVRDRGIDRNAIQFILKQGHSSGSIVFVDGWTAKGVIAAELASSVDALNSTLGTSVDSGLYVLQDIAGVAAASATAEDYLIPSSILNCTVSGLVSRSIVGADGLADDDFHGCRYYSNFEDHDLSRWFADRWTAAVDDGIRDGSVCAHGDIGSVPGGGCVASSVKARLKPVVGGFGVTDWNLVKPGIGEATRVLLRRIPRLLLVRSVTSLDVRHLLVLAGEKSVPVQEVPELPFEAVSLIRRIET